MKKAVILSGGMDSAVALYAQRDAGHECVAVSFDYGQRHRRELTSAARICEQLGVRHVVIDLRALRDVLARSALTSDAPVPDGHYAEASMRATVVPNRNMIMLSIAAAFALSNDCEALVYGAHAGDHAIYPDCRPAFVEHMRAALAVCDYNALALEAPFVDMSKADIAALGARLCVPFADTWSCYRGNVLHCGGCGTCVERREAFMLANVNDPTTYAADAPPLESMLARGEQ